MAFNWLVRPLTWSLGLPSEVGVPLIFGILRKELSLVMLGQALGTVNFDTALSIPQMVTYATFVMFYLPCLATLAVLKRELGTRAMLCDRPADSSCGADRRLDCLGGDGSITLI